MKQIWLVLRKIQSGHDSVHRWTDEQGETILPTSTSLSGGYKKTWFSDNETLLDATESNTILQSIIYQNWAYSSPMLA